MAKQDQVIKFSLVDGVSAGVKKIGESLKELGSIVGKLSILGGAVGAAYAALGGISLVGPIKEAVSLQEAMAKAAAATGATAEQLSDLQRAAEEASRATGFTATESAATLEALGRAGLGAADAIGALVPALNLSKAAAVSTNEAANILADTLDQFGLAGDQAGTVADKLAAGAKNAGTSLGQLTAGLTAVAPQARELGLNLDTTVSALGLLAKQGQEGGKAAAGLREIFASLEDPASKFRKALADIGITSNDFTTVLRQLGEKGKAGEEAIQSLGTKGTAALQALLREGGGALTEFAASIQNSNGALSGLAAIFDNNVAAAFRRFQSAFEALRVKLVEPLLGPIQEELDGLTRKLDEFIASGQFAQLQAAIKDAFTGAVKFVKDFVAEFDFTDAGAKLAKFVSDTGKALKEAGEAAHEVAVIVKGAVDLIKIAIDGVSVASNAAQVAGAKIAESLFGQLAPVSDRFAQLRDGARDLGDAFEDRLGKNVDSLIGRLDELSGAEDGAAEAAGGAGSAMKQVVDITAQRAALIESLIPKVYGAATAEEALAAATRGVTDAKKQNVAVEQARAAADADAATRSKLELEQLAALSQKTKEYHDNLVAQASAAGDAAEATAAAGDAAAEASAQAAGSAESAQASIGGVMGLLKALNERFGAVSENARLLFVDMERSAVRGEASLRLIVKAIVEAGAATQRVIDTQRTVAEGMIASLNRLGTEGPQSLAQLERAFGGSAENARAMAEAARNGLSSINALDQATLDRVGAAIDGAADRMKQLQDRIAQAKDELAGIGDSLQDEIDRLAGNEEGVENRRFEQQLQRIRQLAEETGKLNSAEQARAEQLARKLHEENLRRIREEGEAQRFEDRETERQRSGGGSGGATRPGGVVPTAGTTNITINASGILATDVNEFVQKVKRPMEAALIGLQTPRR